MTEYCPVTVRPMRWVDPEPAEACDQELVGGLCPIHDDDPDEHDWWTERKDRRAEDRE